MADLKHEDVPVVDQWVEREAEYFAFIVLRLTTQSSRCRQFAVEAWLKIEKDHIGAGSPRKLVKFDPSGNCIFLHALKKIVFILQSEVAIESDELIEGFV